MNAAVYWSLYDALSPMGQCFLELMYLTRQRPTEIRLLRESQIPRAYPLSADKGRGVQRRGDRRSNHAGDSSRDRTGSLFEAEAQDRGPGEASGSVHHPGTRRRQVHQERALRGLAGRVRRCECKGRHDAARSPVCSLRDGTPRVRRAGDSEGCRTRLDHHDRGLSRPAPRPLERCPATPSTAKNLEDLLSSRPALSAKSLIYGRGGEIRTRDHLHPMRAWFRPKTIACPFSSKRSALEHP